MNNAQKQEQLSLPFGSGDQPTVHVGDAGPENTANSTSDDSEAAVGGILCSEKKAPPQVTNLRMNHMTIIPISELAEVNPPVDLRGLTDDDRVSFIPMSDVTDGGQWVNRQEKRLAEVRVGYTPFAEGDVLFAKITPCMENGKVLTL